MRSVLGRVFFFPSTAGVCVSVAVKLSAIKPPAVMQTKREKAREPAANIKSEARAVAPLPAGQEADTPKEENQAKIIKPFKVLN